MISMSSLSECITCSSSLSLEEMKLFAIVNWIFHVSNFWDKLRCLLIMDAFKDMPQLKVFYLYYLIFCIHYNCYSKNIYCYWFIVSSSCSKWFLISLSIPSLIALVSCFSLKRFSSLKRLKQIFKCFVI